MQEGRRLKRKFLIVPRVSRDGGVTEICRLAAVFLCLVPPDNNSRFERCTVVETAFLLNSV